ncbi:hypothetical protein HDU67_009717 [Dinochytrium kinnereticum]|nr:hypothetical protein HDU67_009717 [Dinochytrium kinnereticum]
MANALPHLVIFTAEEETDTDNDRSDADEDSEPNTVKLKRVHERPSQSLVGKLPQRTFAVHLLTEPDDVLSLLVTVVPAMLIIEHEGGDDEAREIVKEVLKRMRNGGASSGKRTFIVLWSMRAVKDARERSYWSSLPLQSLSVHVPLFHTQEPGGAVCTVCKENVAFLPKHLKENHATMPESPSSSVPPSQRGSRSMLGGYLSDDASSRPKRPRQPVFALVVVRRPSDGKFLMVDEISSQGWWLPGGSVDVGEDLVKAAERETFEEAGVKIAVKGVLRLEYTPSQHGFRMRVIFYAEPVDPTQKPKTIPDIESAGACWVSLDQLGDHIQLRGREPSLWFPYVAKGGAIWPLPVLTREKDDIAFIPNPFSSRSDSDDSLDESAAASSSFSNLRKK